MSDKAWRWNYRPIRTEDPDGVPFYAVHEVYYEAGKPAGWHANPAPVHDEERRGILKVPAMMTDAISQPVLAVAGSKLIEVVPETLMTDQFVTAMRRINADLADPAVAGGEHG